MRLNYPFVEVSHPAEEENAEVYTCGLEEGDTVYLGAKGGPHCASFSLTPHFFNAAAGGESCSAEANALVRDDPSSPGSQVVLR